MTTLRGLVVMMTCALALAGVHPAAQQRPVFTAKSAGVAVNVFVRNGTVPVLALSSADFVLTDNGVVQTVDTEGIESLPFDLTLALDTSGSAWAITAFCTSVVISPCDAQIANASGSPVAW